MDSKEVEYSRPTESPPSYQAVAEYPTAYSVAPEPTPYPAAVSQQYPPPLQYPPPVQPYPEAAPYGEAYAYGVHSADGYPSTQQQHQAEYGTPQYTASSGPQQVVMVGARQQYRPPSYVPSYIGHIVFACLVLWVCNCLFGFIAFILAMVASSSAVSDPSGARKCGNASIAMSIIGIILTVVVVIAVVAVYASTSSCKYQYFGRCYRDRDYVGWGHCSGSRIGDFCYYN